MLSYLTHLFSELCNSITNYEPQSFEEALGDFQFLFGGWSWKANEFKLWKLSYNHALKAFVHDETNSGDMFYTFIGDELDKSQELLDSELIKCKKVTSRSFDMEPFKVLIEMIRDTSYTSIDGAVQLAKIHPPGSTEFLGVYWPSVSGKKTFLGKNVNSDNNPAVKFVDPDTGEVLEELLPEMLANISEATFSDDYEFIKKCYPEGHLKSDLSKRDKHLLKAIIAQFAYSQFIEKQQLDVDDPLKETIL